MNTSRNNLLKSTPLRRQLLTIAMAGILPLAIAAGLGLATIMRNQAVEAEQRALEVTRLTATAIELELNRSLNVLLALAQSPMLDAGDLPGYEELVRRIMPSVPGWRAVMIATPEGSIVAGTAPAHATASNRLLESESFADVLRMNAPQVGELGHGADEQYGIPLRVPVLRAGQLRYVLTAVLYPSIILDVISTRRLPPNWLTTVLDGNGLHIARTSQHDAALGQPATPSLGHMLQDRDVEGVGLTTTREGNEVYTASVRLPGSGWVVATGMPTDEVQARAYRAFLWYGGGLAVSLLLAVSAALYASRHISRPMRQLRQAAHAIGQHQTPVLPPTDIVEIDEVGQALTAASEARRLSERGREQALRHLQETQGELTQQVSDLQRLQRLHGQLLDLQTLEQQLDAILAVLCELHGSAAGIAALSETSEPLSLRASRGLSAAELALLETALADGPCGWATEHRQRVAVADVTTDARFAMFAGVARRCDFRSMHSTPLTSADGRVSGVMTVLLPGEPRLPSPRELQLADFCAGLAIAFIDRAHARLQAGESEQRLRVALDSSTVPFAVISPLRNARNQITDFTCEFVNRSAAAAIQRQVATLVGVPLGSVLGPLYHRRVVAVCQGAMAHREAREFELEIGSGSHGRWFQVVTTPFQESLAVWFADITERKRQEQLLQQADRRKDAFLATLAHELRNPLAPIRQAATIAGSPLATEAQKQWSREIIERQVRHMVLLLDDLLDISRITLGKLSLRKQHIDLQAVVEAALATVRPQLDAKRHRVDIELPPTPIAFEADPLRVEQIFTNLLTNAAKYTDEGGQITMIGQQDGDSIHLSVIDNGIGIAPGKLAAVFQMFTQVTSSDGRSMGGLGIGLALARGLAQLHGGELTVQSAGLGRGCRFTLSLPIGSIAPTTESDCVAPSTHDTAPLRILVADDNRDIAETMGELLRLEGHQVVVALNGHEAVTQFLEHQPTVALLDIGMPGMSGEDVARAIRALPNGDQVLLVAITGWGQSSDKAQALAAGFDQHLTKPVDIDRILTLIAAVAGSPPQPADTDA